MKKNPASILIAIFLIGFFILQLLIGTLLASLGSSNQNSFAYYQFIFSAFEYIYIAVCLYKERKNLKDFCLDKMSLISLVLANFILVLNSGFRAPGSIYPFIFGLSGFFTLWVVAKHWKSIPEVNWQGLYYSVGITALVLIPTTYISYLSHRGEPIVPMDFWGTIARITLPTFALAAVSEEILFRGFLWGYLKQIGLTENKALVIQGIIFWLIHLINSSTFLPAFLISIPLVAIIYSILTKYTKQLFPSIISHAVYDILVALIWRLFLR